MTNGQHEPPARVSRQVILNLESTLDEEAMRIAIELASSLKASLIHHFIENAQLLQIAALPFAREIRLSTGAQYPFTPRQVMQQLQEQARRSRQRLAHLALPYHLEWQFEVRSHRTPAGLEQQTAELLVYGRRKQPSLRGRSSGPILTLFDGSRASLRGLDMALKLSAHGKDILILLVPDSEHSLESLQAQVREFMSREHLSLPALPFITAQPQQLQAMNRAYHARMLILGARPGLLPDELLGKFIEDSPCPLVIIPQDSAPPADA